MAKRVPYGLNFHRPHDSDTEMLLFERSLSLL
jgi:hypothetical protein